MTDKPKRIPKKGLHWRDQYANIGDTIKVYSLMGKPSFCGQVAAVKRNHHGRISYVVNGKLVLTEELTPLLHKGTVGP